MGPCPQPTPLPPTCCVTGPPRLGCLEGRFLGRFLLISRANPRSPVFPCQFGFAAWLPQGELCLPMPPDRSHSCIPPGLHCLCGAGKGSPTPLWSCFDSLVGAAWRVELPVLTVRSCSIFCTASLLGPSFHELLVLCSLSSTSPHPPDSLQVVGGGSHFHLPRGDTKSESGQNSVPVLLAPQGALS